MVVKLAIQPHLVLWGLSTWLGIELGRPHHCFGYSTKNSFQSYSRRRKHRIVLKMNDIAIVHWLP
jgi:hypothetical protein